MIYVLQIEDYRFVKIGYTANPDISSRVATLQTGCPYEIVPAMTVEGSLMEEKELHAELSIALAKLHLPQPPNEWYPGRHYFMRLVLAELRFGAATASLFIRGYLETKRSGEHEEYQKRHSWGDGPKKKAVHSAEYQTKQEALTSEASSLAILRKRQARQEQVKTYIAREQTSKDSHPWQQESENTTRTK